MLFSLIKHDNTKLLKLFYSRTQKLKLGPKITTIGVPTLLSPCIRTIQLKEKFFFIPRRMATAKSHPKHVFDGICKQARPFLWQEKGQALPPPPPPGQ